MPTVIHIVSKGWEDMSLFFFFSFFFQLECGNVDCGRWHNESVVILTMGQKQDINSKTMSSSLSFDIF